MMEFYVVFDGFYNFGVGIDSVNFGVVVEDGEYRL